MSVKEKAWHNLGQVIDQYPISAEATQFAGLDLRSLRRPNLHAAVKFVQKTGNKRKGIGCTLTNFFATQRTDNKKVVDIVGKDYQIVQNQDAFRFLDAMVGGGDGIC